MPDLSRAELRDLAKNASQVLSDELALHGFNHSAQEGTINGGMVRAVVEALEDAGYVVAKPVIARYEVRISVGDLDQHVAKRTQELAPPPPPTGDDEHGFLGGGLPTPDELDAWGNPRDDADDKTPEPAPPAPTGTPHSNAIDANGPDINSVPATLLRSTASGGLALQSLTPEPPTLEAHPDGWSPKTQADYRTAVALLKRIAHDGVMPSIAEYDAARGNLPQAQTLLARLGLKWSEIAARVGLTPVAPGGWRGKGHGRQSAAPEPKRPAETRQLAPRIAELHATRAAAAEQSAPPVDVTKPIIHHAPDGGVTTILHAADGRHNNMLRQYEDKANADGRPVRVVASFGDGE